MSGPRRREPAGPRVLGRRDRRRGNVEIALVVEAVGDRGADQRHEAQSREPPDMPDEREAEDQADARQDDAGARSAEHTSELQSLMRNSYAVFCVKKKQKPTEPLYTSSTDYKQ